MMKFPCFLLLLFPIFLQAQPEVNIIPQPVSVAMQNGNFSIDKGTTVKFQSSDKALASAAAFLQSYVSTISGYHLSFNKKAATIIELKFIRDDEIGKEGYRLSVKPSVISIMANTKAGIIYGLQTLFQVMPAIRTNAPLIVPCMEIKDYPRFQWRGMHLDVSRHFFGPDIIKEYIDLMASYKFNIFHWHLTDDQGWRIEIKKYPKLTQVGSWRVDKTNLVWGSRPQAKPEEPATYGGYYTQEQIKDIVHYAAQRNITIVPEIEMPGHSAAAIAAYPFLSCTQLPQLPMTGGNYTNMSSNYCAGNDSVFTFLQNVLSEVIQLFPSPIIHIGGDEVDKTSWKNCPKCQARIKKEGLRNEEELQSYFIKRMEKFLISKNRKMIGWDEILEGGLAPEATVMSWRGEAGGIEAAKMNHEVVMTPGSPCYFDHYQAGPEGEPLAIGGMNTLKNVYDYEPVPSEIPDDKKHFVLGAQGNVWTEFIVTAEHLEYMVLPRMLALAEVLWTPPNQKDWSEFSVRLQNQFKAFNQKGLHYCPGNYTVSIKPLFQDGKLLAQLSTEITGAAIYYTTDGTEPTLQSELYQHPIDIAASVTLKASTALNGRIMSLQAAHQNFVMHKAIGKNVTYTNPVSRYYMADGPNSLTDGIRGTTNVGKYWHGISEKDLVATVDLGAAIPVQHIVLGCLQKYNDWIFLPQWVKFEISTDGINYTAMKVVDNPNDINDKEKICDFNANFPPQTARYIRVTAKNNLCPPGHSGAGKPGWIFADEIIVE